MANADPSLFTEQHGTVHSLVCSEAEMCYREQRYCDLQIHCGRGGNGHTSAISCHRLVLACVAPKLRLALRLSEFSLETSGCAVLHFPDFDLDKMRSCIDQIYGVMGGDALNVDLVLDRDISECFGIDESSTTPGFQKSDLASVGASAIEPDLMLPEVDVKLETEDQESVDEAALEDRTEDEDDIALQHRRRRRGHRRAKCEVDDFVVGDEFDENEDIDYDPQVSEDDEPKIKRRRRGRPPGSSSLAAKRRKSELEVKYECDWCGADLAGDVELEQHFVSTPLCQSAKEADRRTAEGLNSAMRSGSGVYEASVANADWAAGQSKQLPFMAKKAYFRAVCGMRRRSSDENRSFTARLLAWSDSSGETDIASQFDLSVAAFKRLYGFSDSDVYNDPILCHKQSTFASNAKTRAQDEVFKSHREKSENEIKALVDDLDNKIMVVEQRSEMRNLLTLEDGGRISISLAADLALENFECISILSWSHSGIDCYPIPVSALEREAASNYCLRSIFETWCTSGGRRVIPKNEHLLQKYRSVSTLYVEREALTTLLSESTPEKQCVDCGIVFKYLTKKDKQRYRDHLVLHERERFTCECTIDFTDSNEKRRHILLVHSEGKYSKCEQCAFIGTHNQVRSHTQSNHKSYICDICGKTTPTKAALSVHTMDHKMYRCDICNVEILGRHKYARHMDTTHSGTWPCEKCGTMFKSRAYLQKHTLIMHQKDEDKPHRCEDCGKGFVGSNALKTHKMNVHIKARPYACRYGCGAAYNDSSNRGHHERKKHGGNFTGGNSNVAAADANMQMGIQQQQQSQLS